MMTKRDTIDAIRVYNSTASPDFLAEFSREELAKYLDRLATMPHLKRADTLSGLAPLDPPEQKGSPVVCP
jgi:hypothetical protein